MTWIGSVMNISTKRLVGWRMDLNEKISNCGLDKSKLPLFMNIVLVVCLLLS